MANGFSGLGQRENLVDHGVQRALLQELQESCVGCSYRLLREEPEVEPADRLGASLVISTASNSEKTKLARATGYEHSKQQLLRKLDDRNANPEIDKLEQDIVETANKLGIGPMGFGGKTTLLGTKIGVLNRLPASYFVSVSYMCWAYRRQGVTLDANGGIGNWLY